MCSSDLAGLADFVILGEENGQLFLSSPLETEETANCEHDQALEEGYGKKKAKKVKKESFSDWRTDLREIMTDEDEEQKEIKEIAIFAPTLATGKMERGK